MAERKRFLLDEIVGPRTAQGVPIPISFDTGFTNRPRTDLMSMFSGPDPTQWHVYFNDFDNYVAGDWTVTETNGDITQALTAGDGGALLLSNRASSDDDLCALQLIQESFKFVLGKQLLFKARFKTAAGATQIDWVMGLQITDSAPLDVTDGVYFQKDDGDTNVDFHVEKNASAHNKTNVAALATWDTSYHTVAFYYDGVSAIQYAFDDVTLGSVAVTNMPDDEDLTVSFAVQNGDGTTAQTMQIDYLFVAKQR